MHKAFIFFVALPLLAISCQGDQASPASQRPLIVSVMNEQAQAWNNGDLEGYMKGYWMSDSLVFSGGDHVARGWQATLDRYKAAYPNQAAMGHLDFSEVETTMLSENAAFSIGKWTLRYADGERAGRFTLVWKKMRGQWFIIADHSS